MRIIALFMALALLLGAASAYVALLDGVNSSGIPAEISVDSPSNSQTTENRNMTFSFTYYPHDSAVSEPMCALYLNGSMYASQRAKTGVAATFFASNLSRSLYGWQIFCEDTKTDLRSFTVSKLPPPELVLRSPQGGVTFENNQQPQFSFVYYSREDELPSTTCRLAIGSFVRTEGPAIDGEALTLTMSDNFTPGTYSWSVQCDRPAGKEKLNSEPRVFFIKAPKPSKNVTPSTPAPPNETIAPPVTYHISLDASGAEGKPVSLMLVGSDGKPEGGVEITVSPSSGASFSIGKTDALGRASFTPRSVGAFSILAPSVRLEQNYSIEISSAANAENPDTQNPPDEIQPGQNPQGQTQSGQVSSLQNSPSQNPAQQNQAASNPESNASTFDFNPLLLGAVAALAGIAIIAGALLLLKKPGAPPNQKPVLNEVK